MDLTTSIVFHTIELVGESHAALTEDRNDALLHHSPEHVDHLDAMLANVDARLERFNALYNALDALNDDDRALLDAGAQRAATVR